MMHVQMKSVKRFDQYDIVSLHVEQLEKRIDMMERIIDNLQHQLQLTNHSMLQLQQYQTSSTPHHPSIQQQMCSQTFQQHHQQTHQQAPPPQHVQTTCEASVTQVPQNTSLPDTLSNGSIRRRFAL